MAICSPSSAVKLWDGNPWTGQRALQGETRVLMVGGKWRGTAGDSGGRYE